MNVISSSRPYPTGSKPLQQKRSSRYTWFLLLALLIGAGTGAGLSIVELLNQMSKDSNSGADRIVELFHSKLDSRRVGEFSYSEIQRLTPAIGSFAEMAVYSSVPVTIGDRTGQQVVQASFVTDNYRDLVESEFILGRGLSCGSYANSRPCPQAIVGSKLWRDRFHSDPSLIGRSIWVSGRNFIVWGVQAPRHPRAEVDGEPQLWLPVADESELLGFQWANRISTVRWLSPIVRLHPGITQGEAQERIGNLLSATSIRSSADEFLLLTPSQVKLARSFRIRGELVSALGTYGISVLWGIIFAWVLGLTWFVVLLTGEGVSIIEATLLWFTSIITTVLFSLVLRHVLVSFLTRFGAPASVAQSHLHWRSLSDRGFNNACCNRSCDRMANTSEKKKLWSASGDVVTGRKTGPIRSICFRELLDKNQMSSVHRTLWSRTGARAGVHF